jgi:hypothetical protein
VKHWWIAIALTPVTAHAYSDPAMFGDPVEEGGGGGRYFTGSRAEKYSCSVCHQGGEAPRFVIDPLPAVLEEGTRYSLVIHWSDPESPQGLQLELATATGADPAVTIPAPAALPATSRCEGSATGLPAIYSVDIGIGSRRVVGVEDCGASRVEVSFVATGNPIEVSIGGVRSNEDGTPNGDGVFDERFILSPAFHASGGGCAVGGDSFSVVPFVAWLLLRRRRSRKLDAE